MPISPARRRVLVAMSGGVDSSLAAALLRDEGHDVVGVTLHLWDYPDDGSVRGRCCAPEDQHDARRVADQLGIPHFSFDRRETFLDEVVTPFVDAYLAGETPSPCAWCNRGPKFRELFALADRLGADAIATGHYARVSRKGDLYVLLRAADDTKDQSYFLHALRQDELARLLLPLGDRTKADVRREAAARGLAGAEKGESQELCFVPTGRYDAFVAGRADGRIRPGKIVDDRGRTVGTHEGIHAFTVGQRKGIGVALGAPAYVVAVDAESATVHVGPADALAVRSIEVGDVVLASDVGDEFDATVKVRARHDGARATVRRVAADRVSIRFHEPVRAVTVGQFAVAYADDRVLGGGRIATIAKGATA